MKKRVLGLFLTALLYLGVPNVVYAAEPVRICELEQVIVNIFNLVIAVTPFIGLAILVYGAVLWMTAAADPQKLQLAQSTLTNGVVGLVLGLSAVLIVVTIESFLLSGEDAFRWSDGAGAFVNVQICSEDAVEGEDNPCDPNPCGPGDRCEPIADDPGFRCVDIGH